VIRTVQRGYYDRSEPPAGQVRRVHVIREEGPRGWDGPERQTWCGQGTWNGQHSPPVIRDAPHDLPRGLSWCPKCTGLLAERLGRINEVATLLGLSGAVTT
jgi:hypothetical protein